MEVLLVEDNALLSRSLVRALRPHRVTHCVTGEDAFALLVSGRRFDVIIADHRLPYMAGSDLYQEILMLDAQQADRVLIMSGAPAAEMEFFEERWLLKPFTREALMHAIDAVCPPTASGVRETLLHLDVGETG